MLSNHRTEVAPWRRVSTPDRSLRIRWSGSLKIRCVGPLSYLKRRKMVAFRDQSWPAERLRDLSTRGAAAQSLRGRSCKSLLLSKNLGEAVSRSCSPRDRRPTKKENVRQSGGTFTCLQLP